MGEACGPGSCWSGAAHGEAAEVGSMLAAGVWLWLRSRLWLWARGHCRSRVRRSYSELHLAGGWHGCDASFLLWSPPSTCGRPRLHALVFGMLTFSRFCIVVIVVCPAMCLSRARLAVTVRTETV